MLVQVPSGLVAFEEVFSAHSLPHFFSTNAYRLFPKAKGNRITRAKPVSGSIGCWRDADCPTVKPVELLLMQVSLLQTAHLHMLVYNSQH